MYTIHGPLFYDKTCTFSKVDNQDWYIVNLVMKLLEWVVCRKTRSKYVWQTNKLASHNYIVHLWSILQVKVEIWMVLRNNWSHHNCIAGSVRGRLDQRTQCWGLNSRAFHASFTPAFHFVRWNFHFKITYCPDKYFQSTMWLCFNSLWILPYKTMITTY